MDNSTNKFLMSPADIQICQVIHTISKHTTIKNYFFFFNTTRFWRADEKTLEWSHLRLHQIWYELFSSSLNDFRQLAPQNQITSNLRLSEKRALEQSLPVDSHNGVRSQYITISGATDIWLERCPSVHLSNTTFNESRVLDTHIMAYQET